MTYDHCKVCPCKVCPGKEPIFWQKEWSLDYQYSRQLESTKTPCWILCYPRTGSNYLCWCFNLTANFVPCFAEWFNPPVDHRPPDDCCHLYVPWKLWSTIKPTDVVYHEKVEPLLDRLPPYLKVHCCDYHCFFKPEHYEQIIQKLPGIKFIRLRRRDLIACTASYYLAQKTKIFSATKSETVAEQASIRVEIDESLLLQYFEWMVDWDAYWEYFLPDNNYLEIFYEDLVTDPKVAQTACEYIGFPADHLEGRFSDIKEKKLQHPQTPELIETLKNNLKQLDNLRM